MQNNNNETTPPPAPETAPEVKETPPASNLAPLIQIAKAIFKTTPRQPTHGEHLASVPPWLFVLGAVWPLALFGGGVALFCVIGANGWLWLVLALVIVCGIFARPPRVQ
jgi:hypothetical protein